MALTISEPTKNRLNQL